MENPNKLKIEACKSLIAYIEKLHGIHKRKYRSAISPMTDLSSEKEFFHNFKNSKAQLEIFSSIDIKKKKSSLQLLKPEKSFSHEMHIYHEFSKIGVQVPLYHSDLEPIESELLSKLPGLEEDGKVELEERKR